MFTGPKREGSFDEWPERLRDKIKIKGHCMYLQGQPIDTHVPSYGMFYGEQLLMEILFEVSIKFQRR